MKVLLNSWLLSTVTQLTQKCIFFSNSYQSIQRYDDFALEKKEHVEAVLITLICV